MLNSAKKCAIITSTSDKRKQRNRDGWNPSGLRCRLRHIELVSSNKDIILKALDSCYIISQIQHFINALQAIAHRLPGVVGACCNVSLWEPLNVPQKSYLSVNPPKRCAFDSSGHLLPVKSLQAQWQHYTSRRHRQHRAKKAAAALRRCALERSRSGYVPFCRRWQNGHTPRATKSGTHADHKNSAAFARMYCLP